MAADHTSFIFTYVQYVASSVGAIQTGYTKSPDSESSSMFVAVVVIDLVYSCTVGK